MGSCVLLCPFRKHQAYLSITLECDQSLDRSGNTQTVQRNIDLGERKSGLETCLGEFGPVSLTMRLT